MMPRVVVAEVLDGLAANDPAALHSRRDLQRIHRLMGTRGLLVQHLRRMAAAHTGARPLRMLELGAGDGSLMLGVAGALKGQLPRVEFTLLDQQALVPPATLAAYADAGWHATVQVMDVLDWMQDTPGESTGPAAQTAGGWDVIVANLFLHHFQGDPLADLLGAIAGRCRHFFACEPRRAGLALAGSRLVGLIGANAVTRQDAVLSVQAGFQGCELSALWPAQATGWTLDEYPAGLFSHCLRADRGAAQKVARP